MSGPYLVEPDNDWPLDDLAIVTMDGTQVAIVLGNGEAETARANLYAVAEDMLRFVRCVLEYEERVHPGIGSPFATEARTLIARAGGKS